MTRARLRTILKNGGVRVGSKYDGGAASIVEFIDQWGIMAGVYDDVSTAAIKRALEGAGVAYTMGNMVMVTA